MDTPINIKNGIATICARTGIHLTNEQKEVVYNFNNSMAVFANPGSGKTTTATVGLIAAQTLFGIQGRKINAMSFTRLATAELSGRYKAACKKCNVVDSIKFNTFHSICNRIIKRAYPNFKIKSGYNIEQDLENIKLFMKDEGVEDWEDMFFVKVLFKSISSLNNEMLYSKGSVENSSYFIKIKDKITLKQFQKVRSRWFLRNYLAQVITQGDIPSVALVILLTNDKIRQEFLNEFDLMVVDEFQDMSLMYLKVLSLISKNLIVIGDIKQQIFGFNGASLLILDAYSNLYPEAIVLDITQSFRNKNEIANLANRIISRNNIKGFDKFKGTGDGGVINYIENDPKVFDETLCELKDNQIKKKFSDVMFLSRNNASVVPIIEKLYSNNIAFRTTKLVRVMDLPIFKDLCMMAEIAMNPTDPVIVANINRFFPEFKWIKKHENPILDVMKISSRESDKNFLTMNFVFNDQSSYKILNHLRRFAELENDGVNFGVSCLVLLDIYEEFVIENKWWKLDQTKEYYFNLVESIISTKSYKDMVYDENDKYNKNDHYCTLQEGIRCYTFHASKGLESDTVYLLDVDEDVIPKYNSINDLVEIGCPLEASKELRNERNLMYVAITRCKSNLFILYNKELSSLVCKPEDNKYNFLDEVWENDSVLANEDIAFEILVGIRK